MPRIITFGEIMLRLNPEGYLRFVQANSFEATYAGAEANTAVSLANYGMDAAFITKLPAHEIGQCAINELRRYGVDTSGIVRGGPRLGVYYLEKGASQRASKVIYDRADSSIALAQPEDFDWDAILDGADWFHFSGITPALGGRLPEICLAALQAAKARGLTVSCDSNYRSKLWTLAEAGPVMCSLMPYVDVCLTNAGDAADLFDVRADGENVDFGNLSQEQCIQIARRLHDRLGCETVALTLRRSISANDNDWGGMLYRGGKASFSPTYRMHIVDRVGGGDSFSGGLIYGLLAGKSDQDALNFAVAASCLKHSVEHDFNMMSVAEVESLAGGNASGRVQR